MLCRVSINTRHLSARAFGKRAHQTRRGRSVTRRPVVKASVSGFNSAATVGSPHPDALRRRQEAEARKLRRQISLERQTTRPTRSNLPSNVCLVENLSDGIWTLVHHIEDDPLVVVFFSAPWCLGCRSLYSKFTQIASNNPELTFIKVHLEDDVLRVWCAENLEVNKLPYFHFYKNGQLISQFSVNVSTISVLRAEIASLKDCVGHMCNS